MRLINLSLLLCLVTMGYTQPVITGFEASKLCSEEVIRKTYVHDTLRKYTLVQKTHEIDVVNKAIQISVYLSSESSDLPKYLMTDVGPDLPDPNIGFLDLTKTWSMTENIYLDDVKLNNDFFIILVNPYFDCYIMQTYDCDSIKIYRKQPRKVCPTHVVYTTNLYRINEDSLIVNFQDEEVPQEFTCLAEGWRVQTDSMVVKTSELSEKKDYHVFYSDTNIICPIVPPCRSIIRNVELGNFYDCKPTISGSKLCDEKVYVKVRVPSELREYKFEGVSVYNDFSTGDNLLSTTIYYHFLSETGQTAPFLEIEIGAELPDPSQMIGGPKKETKLKVIFEIDATAVELSDWEEVDFYKECFIVKDVSCDVITVERKKYNQACPVYNKEVFTNQKVEGEDIEIMFVDSLYETDLQCLGEGYVLASHEIKIEGLENKNYHLLMQDSAFIDCEQHVCYEDYIKRYFRIIPPRSERVDLSGCLVNGNVEYLEEYKNVFPNPTTGILNVKNHHQQLILLDIQGNQYSLQGDESYDLSALKEGIYFLQIKGEAGEIKTIKVVKQ